MAVVGGMEGKPGPVVTPCGRCRQVLNELAQLGDTADGKQGSADMQRRVWAVLKAAEADEPLGRQLLDIAADPLLLDDIFYGVYDAAPGDGPLGAADAGSGKKVASGTGSTGCAAVRRRSRIPTSGSIRSIRSGPSRRRAT